MGDDFETVKPSLDAELSDGLSRLETTRTQFQEALSDLEDLINDLQALQNQMRTYNLDELNDDETTLDEALNQLNQVLSDMEDAISVLENVYLPSEVS